MKDTTEWYIKKKNNNQYGPVPLDDLMQWAAQCRIVAGNEASQDQKVWIPVEDIPELEMDWFAERQDGKRYGPFPLAAVTALVEHRVLPDDAILTHRSSNEMIPMQRAREKLSEKSPQQTRPTNAEPAKKAPQRATPSTEPAAETKTRKNENAVTPAQEGTAHNPPPEDKRPQEDEQVAQLQAEIKDLQKQIKDLLRAARDQERMAEQQAQQAEQDIGTLQTEFDALKEQAAEQRQQTQAQLQERAEQIEALQETLAKEQAANTRNLAQNRQTESHITDARQQVAFMKKNIAALNAQLATARETAAQRAKMLAGAWVVVTLVTAALILALLGRGCQRTRQELPKEVQSSALSDETDTLPPIADQHRTDNRAPNTETAAEPLRAINIDGIHIISQDANALSLRFEESIFSSLDNLSPEGRQLLDALARQLPRGLSGWKLEIDGHTDNIPLRSTSRFANNEALAMARANAVAEHFKQRAGFPEEAITARAGSTAPFPNDSAENRQRNRTVTIKLQRR